MAEYLETPGPWIHYEAGHVFVWYDASPMLFEAKIGETDIIAMWITSEEAGNDVLVEYIAWEMDRSLPIVQDFVADHIDLRDLMLSSKVGIFELGSRPVGSEFELVGRKVRRVLEEDVIPDPGVFWSEYMEDAKPSPERKS
jgi:hypothetical protein